MATAPSATTTDQEFAELVEPYRSELHAHCYRMLGSAYDADDALQDAMLRAWKGLGRFDGKNLRAWLYKISTNTCLDIIGKRPARTLPMDMGGPSDPAQEQDRPMVEDVWVEPYMDERYGLEDGRARPRRASTCARARRSRSSPRSSTCRRTSARC